MQQYIQYMQIKNPEQQQFHLLLCAEMKFALDFSNVAYQEGLLR